MWIGDVGQDHWEEINLRTAGSSDPIYYGWHCMEGTSVFNSSQQAKAYARMGQVKELKRWKGRSNRALRS